MIELYKRLARGCKTVNQLNRAHIALDRLMTPLELMGLRAELRRRGWVAQRVSQVRNLPKKAHRLLIASLTTVQDDKFVASAPPLTGIDKLSLSKAWIDELHRKFALAGKDSPEPFVRRRLRQAVWIFKSDCDRRQKMLLICFSGNGQRPMMPMPVFLQHIDGRATDVAYLRTEQRAGYRKGIRGVANDLHASIAALEGLLDVREYRRVATIGMSGGALPAILAGLQLGVDAILSVGPNSPNDDRWTGFVKGKGATDLFRRFASGSTKTPEVYLVHGAKSARDAAAATVIASCIQVRDIKSVPNARHGALYPLVKRGQFGDLLRSTVFNWPATRDRSASRGTQLNEFAK